MSSILLGIRRLRARPWLSLVLLLGLATTVAVPASIARYSDAAALRALLSAVDEIDAGGRPPLSTLFEASTDEPRPWAEIQGVSDLLVGSGAINGRLGLPTVHRSEQIDSVRFEADRTTTGNETATAGFRSLTALSDLDDRVTFVAGRSPRLAATEDPIEVVASESAGLGLGDTLVLQVPNTSIDDPLRRIDARVVGLWSARDPDADEWIVEPDLLADRLFVARSVLTESDIARTTDLIRSTRWFEILDGESLTTDRIDDLLGRLDRLATEAARTDDETRLVRQPGEALARFEVERAELNRRLLVFAIPLLGLLGAFIVLTVAIVSDDRRDELTMLRSRGARPFSIAASVAAEALLLGAVALLLGLAMSEAIVALMGSVRSFATFDGSIDIGRVWPRSALTSGLLVVAVSVLVQTVPSLGVRPCAIGDPGTDHRRRIAAVGRTLRTIVFTAAVLGSVSLLDRRPRSTTDLLSQPMVVLLPALLSLAVGLAVVAVMPLPLRALGAVAGRLNNVPLLLASRRLVRDPGPTRLPVLLMVVTLSLATFTATLARSLDLGEQDRIHHEVGSDLRLTEAGGLVRPVAVGIPSTEPTDRTVIAPAGPVGNEAFESIPGVEAATRVADYSGRVSQLGAPRAIRVLGIEPSGFEAVAYWRDDYANVSLTELMRRLDQAPENVLIDRRLADDLGLTVGSEIDLTAIIRSQAIETPSLVVGIVDQVPTDDGEEPVVLARSDQLWLLSGEAVGFTTWMRTSQSVDEAAFDALGAQIVGFASAGDRVDQAFDEPGRQAIFALLTVSFGGSVLLSVAGLLLYAVRSHRRSTGETGVLAALGLGFRPLATIVALDLGLLILLGLGAGLASGLALGRWLTPALLQVDTVEVIPPLLAATAWSAVTSLALITVAALVSAVLVVIGLVRRVRLFEAIKMGGVR